MLSPPGGRGDARGPPRTAGPSASEVPAVPSRAPISGAGKETTSPLARRSSDPLHTRPASLEPRVTGHAHGGHTRVHACQRLAPPPQHVHEPLPVAFCLMLVPLRDDHLACRDEFRHHSLPAGPCRSFQREQPSSPSPAAPRERGHLRSPTSPKCTTRGGRSGNTRGLYRLVCCVEFFFSRLPFVQCWKV